MTITCVAVRPRREQLEAAVAGCGPRIGGCSAGVLVDIGVARPSFGLSFWVEPEDGSAQPCDLSGERPNPRRSGATNVASAASASKSSPKMSPVATNPCSRTTTRSPSPPVRVWSAPSRRPRRVVGCHCWTAGDWLWLRFHATPAAATLAGPAKTSGLMRVMVARRRRPSSRWRQCELQFTTVCRRLVDRWARDLGHLLALRRSR